MTFAYRDLSHGVICMKERPIPSKAEMVRAMNPNVTFTEA